MNDIQPPSGITRRSFIKRSVVAAVAVSSMTIFSGLVNAAGEDIFGSGSEVTPSCVRDRRDSQMPSKPEVGETGHCPGEVTCTWGTYRAVFRDGKKIRIKEGWIRD